MKGICLRHSRPRRYWSLRSSREEAGTTAALSHGPAPSNDPDEAALKHTVRLRALQAGEGILRAFSEELKRGEHTLLEVSWEQVVFYADVVKLTEWGTDAPREAPTPPRETLPPAVPVYVVSSLFLADCHRFLLSSPQGFELLHLVTGSKVDACIRTLERMEKVALESHSEIHAEADQYDLQRRLIAMSAWGHSMHGLFHAHPGQGRDATRPSGKDLATHERYERGGYPLVGAIFVRDGFVRFFSHHRPFTIKLFGTGVTQHDEHVFKIENPPCPVSYETVAAGKRQERHHPEAGATCTLPPASAA